MAVKGRNKPKRKRNPTGKPKLPKDPKVGHGTRFGNVPAGFRDRVSRGAGGSDLGLGVSGAFGSPVGPRVEKLLDFKERKKATMQATPNRVRRGVKERTKGPKKFPSFRSGSAR